MGRRRARGGPRILIYSHDTLGLGHLRRCRTIAHALVERGKDLSVLILSGSPIIGSFDFKARVDFVRVPGVIKLRNGEYTSLNLHIDIKQMLDIRASIIRHTAEAFHPDLFLVDKEPVGLRGEVTDTLVMLKSRGVPLVLGLRDVMDDPGLLEPEWKRKNAMPALRDLYDDIWIYGLPQMCDPLAGLSVPKSVKRKISYTGYLKRTAAPALARASLAVALREPYILATTGGGGDGEALIDWVLRAYEHDQRLPYRALLVLGPFMQPERQAEFLARAGRLPNVEAITFDAHLEERMARAAGVVAMGGYNTFCEILSFDKRAIIVPRTEPRLEQSMRAARAQELGLVRMLGDDGKREVRQMVDALRRMPEQPLPSDMVIPGLLDGLDNVNRRVGRWLGARAPLERRLAVVPGE
ncbi:MAG: glycosyltransferase family protein [Pseudomonadota bacterium]